jgi:hypothetical protein
MHTLPVYREPGLLHLTSGMPSPTRTKHSPPSTAAAAAQLLLYVLSHSAASPPLLSLSLNLSRRAHLFTQRRAEPSAMKFCNHN